MWPGEKESEGVGWIQRAEDAVQRWALVNMIVDRRGSIVQAEQQWTPPGRLHSIELGVSELLTHLTHIFVAKRRSLKQTLLAEALLSCL
jgi:hypothetical protein